MISKIRISTLIIIVGCLCLAGCSHTKSSQDSRNHQPIAVTKAKAVMTESKAPRPLNGASGNPIIGHLKTRDKIITIQTGSDGPLYTVKSIDGKILAVDLQTAELSAKFPELKEVVERGIADWAGMDLQIQKTQGPVELRPMKTNKTK